MTGNAGFSHGLVADRRPQPRLFSRPVQYPETGIEPASHFVLGDLLRHLFDDGVQNSPEATGLPCHGR